MSDTDNTKNNAKINNNVLAAIFLSGVAGMSLFAGFFQGISMYKKQDTKNFEKGLLGAKDLPESAVALARRAFLWGSVWAVGGFSLWFFSIWKIIGSPSFKEFQEIVRHRYVTDSLHPDKTEFTSITNFMKYVSKEEGEEK